MNWRNTYEAQMARLPWLSSALAGASASCKFPGSCPGPAEAVPGYSGGRTHQEGHRKSFPCPQARKQTPSCSAAAGWGGGVWGLQERGASRGRPREAAGNRHDIGAGWARLGILDDCWTLCKPSCEPLHRPSVTYLHDPPPLT